MDKSISRVCDGLYDILISFETSDAQFKKEVLILDRLEKRFSSCSLTDEQEDNWYGLYAIGMKQKYKRIPLMVKSDTASLPLANSA